MKALVLPLFARACVGLLLSALLADWLATYFVYPRQIAHLDTALNALKTEVHAALDPLPPERRDDALQALAARWDFDVSLTSLADLERGEDTLLLRAKKNRLWLTMLRGPLLQVLLPDNQTVVELGPIDRYAFEGMLDVLVYVLIMAAGLALALWWPLRSLQARLQRLVRSGLALAGGDWSVRLLDDRADGLGELARGLNRLAEKAEGRLKEGERIFAAQRDLLHAVAHEFRSPLARVQFALDLLSEGRSAEERRNFQREIQKALGDLDELVTELLDYARLEHPQEPLVLGPLRPAYVLIDLLNHQRPLAPRLHIGLDWDEDSEARILADERLLARALLNLLRNAVRFARSQVVLGGHFDGDQIVFTVDDDGPGIPPGKREFIFEPFARLDASRSRDSGGVGLGLAIVRSISARHGGLVEVGDSPWGGARFILRWPIHAKT